MINELNSRGKYTLLWPELLGIDNPMDASHWIGYIYNSSRGKSQIPRICRIQRFYRVHSNGIRYDLGRSIDNLNSNLTLRSLVSSSCWTKKPWWTNSPSLQEGSKKTAASFAAYMGWPTYRLGPAIRALLEIIHRNHSYRPISLRKEHGRSAWYDSIHQGSAWQGSVWYK